MAVGTNVQLHISEVRDDVLVVVELDRIRFPSSLDELPQLLPYLGRLYNAIGTVHRCCYHHNNTAHVLSERAHLHFLEVVKCIEDEDKRQKALKKYDDWRDSREAKIYWNERSQVVRDNTDSSTTQQTATRTILLLQKNA